MKLTPIEFLSALKDGKSEFELNRKSELTIDKKELRKLIKYGHDTASATEHLQTDYSDGYTICKECGSFYELGEGFTKHLSSGCLNCQGEAKHRVYFVEKSQPKYGGFPARYMSVMFDDGMSYCKDRLEINKYMGLV